MPAYIQGNLALKENNEIVTRRQAAPRRNAQRPTMPAMEKMFYLAAIVALFILCGAILYQYAQLYSINVRIQDVEREIHLLEKENGVLQLESQGLREPKRLIELGKEFGFSPTSEEAVITVSASKHIVRSKEENVAYAE